MRVQGWRWVSVLCAVVLAVPLVLPAAAGAQSGGAYLDGAEPWTESDCAGEVPIVVGSDAAAQSDIYSAVTLAGVVGTDCVILAGPRGAAMPAAQRARLDAAAAGGYVVGGTAAVPDAKLTGRVMTRLGGADRWATAQIIGNEASYLADGTRPDSPTMSETALTVPADVSEPGVFLDGAEPWFAADCAGDVPIVVGSDAAAQSDIYSAVTLAGVLGTDCVVLAGPRDSPMPASQQTRLDAAAGGGFVLGGIAAVPTAKIAGRDMTRLGGASRWETAQLVGRRASGDTIAGTSTSIEPSIVESEEIGSETETVTEEEESMGFVLEIEANPTWMAEYQAIEDFAAACGLDYEEQYECDDPEDTQTLIQMIEDYHGDECGNFELGYGCSNLSPRESWALNSLRACPRGWAMASNLRCYHPNHDLYYSPYAYHPPSEANSQGVPADYWDGHG
ncbi:hypothetical protein [Candidatus Poriferisodalis sp.]|uniref:hypothetical protein n=1 Tax=Candidatus Poriferisodalis sp. TaxID=3101277 RepID=UPI003B5167FD